MATIMWCAECGHEVSAEFVEKTGYHFTDMSLKNWDVCAGPFFTSAPPENLPDNWQDELVEPSEEDMDEMDQGAELLLWDLGLMEK